MQCANFGKANISPSEHIEFEVEILVFCGQRKSIVTFAASLKLNQRKIDPCFTRKRHKFHMVIFIPMLFCFTEEKNMEEE